MQPLPRIAAVLAVAVFAVNCGGGASPTGPTAAAATPSPAAPAATVVTGPYTFDFAAGTNTTDQNLIRDAIQFAHDFMQSTFGRTVEQQTAISGVVSAAGCTQGAGAAFTGPRAITFCLGNPGWTVHGPITKQKIVIHELYHVLQFERRWIGQPATGPHWMIEGAAEVVSYRAVASRNLLAYPTAIGCQVKEAFDFDTRQPPGLPALSLLETALQFQSTAGPTYTVSMLGIDQLLTIPGIAALNTYMDAIAGGAGPAAWQSAFQSAFGTSSATFYAQFPAYRSGLPVPPTYVCGV